VKCVVSVTINKQNLKNNCRFSCSLHYLSLTSQTNILCTMKFTKQRKVQNITEMLLNTRGRCSWVGQSVISKIKNKNQVMPTKGTFKQSKLLYLEILLQFLFFKSSLQCHLILQKSF